MRYALILLALASAATAAPPDVPVIHPIKRDVFEHIDATGRTEANTMVEVRPRVTGYLEKVAFKEGSAVKKGDLLFQIDDRIQRAELAKAEAQMKQTEAGLKLAEADRARIANVVKMGGAGQDELDRATAALETAKATVVAARATIELAKLNLDFTRISSPIDGRIGRANVDAGNLVREGDALAMVVALDPIHAIFDLDERSLLRVRASTRDRPDRRLLVGVAMTGDERYPRKGEIDFVDVAVDPKTGTIRMRAVLQNPKDEIRPGQFVRVRVPLGDPRPALLLPETAFLGSQSTGVRVLVVNAKNVTEERPVKLGPREDGLYAIEDGLKSDDWVVRDAHRHKVGVEVKPQPVKDPPAGGKPSGTGLLPAPARPPAEFPGTGPALVITATYPGANATTVEEAVAAPIGQQIDGLAGMSHPLTACSEDGTMRMTLLFEKGTDLNKAQILAQNRIALAEPVLAGAVRRPGVMIRKRGIYLGSVVLVSSDGRFDRIYLTNFATLQLRDELARVEDVADVTFYSDTEPGPRIHMEVDADRLAAFGLTAADVTAALQGNNLIVESGRTGVFVQGRVLDPEQLGDLIVKADKDGRLIRLRSIARLELAMALGTTAQFDGKPATILIISRLPGADAKETATAIRTRVAELAKHLPEGLEMKVIDGD